MTQRPPALITGASSGIGLHLAQEFARHGYDLIVAAVDEGIMAAAAKLAVDGTSAGTVQVDLRLAEGKVVAESMTTKMMGIAKKVLPDSVTTLGNRLLSRPVRH